jgi:hypothetical protein
MLFSLCKQNYSLNSTVILSTCVMSYQCFPVYFTIWLHKLTIKVIKIEIDNAFAEKQGKKAHQRLAFIPVSKACTNKLYIFQQCTYIVYVFSISTELFLIVLLDIVLLVFSTILRVSISQFI